MVFVIFRRMRCMSTLSMAGRSVRRTGWSVGFGLLLPSLLVVHIDGVVAPHGSVDLLWSGFW